MVEFWGIFVVFSACAAFHLAESRYHDAYSPLDLSGSDFSQSDQEHGLSNNIGDSSNEWNYIPTHMRGDSLESSSLDSSQEPEDDPPKGMAHSEEQGETTIRVPKPSKPTAKKHLTLNQRRQHLFELARDGMREYEKDFVRLTREAIKNVVVELEALPVKSHKVKEKLAEVKQALMEIEDVDLDGDSSEFDAIGEASDIVGDLNAELGNASPELERVLEKVGWMDIRYKLGDEMLSFIDRFGKEFNIFIASLTPWERLMETGLVELHRRFAKGDTDTKWNSFTEFWTYFDL